MIISYLTLTSTFKGPEIDSCGSEIFKLKFIHTEGTSNVYSTGQGTAHNQTIGFRLSACSLVLV